MPKISVIIPVYNVEEYLSRCLDSIVSQSFVDFECILIDDGSKDLSANICEQYALKDSRFKVFKQKNAGVSSARNAGISKVLGDYFCFVDSDDYVDSEYLQKMYDACTLSNADLVFCGLKKQLQDKTFVEYNPFFEDKHFSRKQFLDVFSFLRKPENAVYLHSPYCKLYSTKFYADCRFKEDVSYGEDYLFNLDTFEKTQKISFIKDNLYNYANNDNSITQTAKVNAKLISNNGLQLISTIKFCKRNKINICSKGLIDYFLEVSLHFYQQCCSINKFDFSNDFVSKSIPLKIIFKSLCYETKYPIALISIKTKKNSFFKKYFTREQIKKETELIENEYSFIIDCLKNNKKTSIDKDFISSLNGDFLLKSFLYFRLRRFFLFLFIKLRMFCFLSFIFSLKQIAKKNILR